MICSMTGFGRGRNTVNGRTITVEIRSVNHRYLELSTRLPKEFYPLDQKIRRVVQERISRGKTDLTVIVERNGDADAPLHIDESIAEFYVKNSAYLSERFSIKNDLSAGSLLCFPDVVTSVSREESPEELMNDLMPALTQALDMFVEARADEGRRLADDLALKFDELEADTQAIEAIAPELVTRYRDDLKAKVLDLLGGKQLDEARIAQEVTIYADKICIDEELVRLKSHVKEVRKCLTSKEPVGRRLDFLAQELNRESNTILSKSTDVATANLGIHLKTLIEKIREQIQNIE